MNFGPKNLALIGTCAAVAFVLWKWGVSAPVIAAAWIGNLTVRGNKLSDSTLQSGVVLEVPEVLIDMASAVLGITASLDVYTLARAGRSEGVDGMEYRMHVILNMFAEDNAKYPSTYPNVTTLATHSKNATANGHYSSQGLGKPFSTAHDPYEGDYALATKVYLDRVNGNDPTGGAVKFVDRSGPFYIDGDEVTYADIVASWAQEGLTPQTLPGATSNFVVFVRA